MENFRKLISNLKVWTPTTISYERDPGIRVALSLEAFKNSVNSLSLNPSLRRDKEDYRNSFVDIRNVILDSRPIIWPVSKDIVGHENI